MFSNISSICKCKIVQLLIWPMSKSVELRYTFNFDYHKVLFRLDVLYYILSYSVYVNARISLGHPYNWTYSVLLSVHSTRHQERGHLVRVFMFLVVYVQGVQDEILHKEMAISQKMFNVQNVTYSHGQKSFDKLCSDFTIKLVKRLLSMAVM